MKLIPMLSLFALLYAAPYARANCADQHSALADQKFNEAMKQGVLALFKQKGIAVDPAKVVISYSTTGFQSNFEDPEDKYVQYYGSGTVVSASGTKFNVYETGPYRDEDGHPTGYLMLYLAVLTSDGFDREGNAINPHCTLKYDEGGIPNYADSYVISNAVTDKVIGKLPLPKRIVLY